MEWFGHGVVPYNDNDANNQKNAVWNQNRIAIVFLIEFSEVRSNFRERTTGSKCLIRFQNHTYIYV